MVKLILLECPHCGADFGLARRHLKGVEEVACPVCQETFDPFDEDDDEVDEA